MKKLKLDPDALAVTSFATDTVPQARGTIEARGVTTLEQFTRPSGITTSDYPNTWGTGPCTTAPSSDFPCDGNDGTIN
jgi:hypothetical protein